MKKRIELHQLRPGDIVMLSQPIDKSNWDTAPGWRIKSHELLDEIHTAALTISVEESTTKSMFKVCFLLSDSLLQKSLHSLAEVILIQ